MIVNFYQFYSMSEKKLLCLSSTLHQYFTRNYIFYMYVTGSSLFSPIHRSLIRDIKREITFLLCLVVALIAAITGSIHRFSYLDSVDVISKASTNKTATCSHVPTVYSRTPISRTKSIISLGCHPTFQSLIKNSRKFSPTTRILVLVTPLGCRPISSSRCVILTNTIQHYSNLILIGATNRSRFITKHG